MTLRFRKRIKVAPGVYLNIGKSGVSGSFGPRGMSVNVKPGKKVRVTAGIPGSGLSVSEETSGASFGTLFVLALFLAGLAAFILF